MDLCGPGRGERFDAPYGDVARPLPTISAGANAIVSNLSRMALLAMVALAAVAAPWPVAGPA